MRTRTLSIANAGAIEAAIACLAGGGLAAVPTETVYGLAGDATSGRSVAAIYEAKGRPSFNPLIVHVASRDMARAVADFDATAERLADLFWPGPLTLVLASAAGSPVAALARAGLPTVAVRMPQGPLRDIVQGLDRPVAAPSANASGRVSPTNAAHVLRSLDSAIDLVLDGGACDFGVESTILKVGGGKVQLLRPGALSVEEIEERAGLRLEASGRDIEAPGQMRSHYAPHGRLRLDATSVEPGEHLIAFGVPTPGADRAVAVFDLSPAGDLREAASRLFEALSAFDDTSIERIAVAPIPRHGLGLAINDRLARAAAPR